MKDISRVNRRRVYSNTVYYFRILIFLVYLRADFIHINNNAHL
jgi:hypothetical protein